MPRDQGQVSGRSPDGRLYPHPDVVSRRLGDRLVLVNLSDNRIFELNRTGARVWELLQETHARGELLAELQAEFEVEEENLAAEVDALLETLHSRGLLAGARPASR